MQTTATDHNNMLHTHSCLDGVYTCTSLKLVHTLCLEYELLHQTLSQTAHMWYGMLVSSMNWNRCLFQPLNDYKIINFEIYKFLIRSPVGGPN